MPNKKLYYPKKNNFKVDPFIIYKNPFCFKNKKIIIIFFLKKLQKKTFESRALTQKHSRMLLPKLTDHYQNLIMKRLNRHHTILDLYRSAERNIEYPFSDCLHSLKQHRKATKKRLQSFKDDLFAFIPDFVLSQRHKSHTNTSAAKLSC